MSQRRPRLFKLWNTYGCFFKGTEPQGRANLARGFRLYYVLLTCICLHYLWGAGGGIGAPAYRTGQCGPVLVGGSHICRERCRVVGLFLASSSWWPWLPTRLPLQLLSLVCIEHPGYPVLSRGKGRRQSLESGREDRL